MYDIKLHLILWLQSCRLGNMDEPFFTITLKFTHIVPVEVPSMGQMEGYNYLLRIIIKDTAGEAETNS